MNSNNRTTTTGMNPIISKIFNWSFVILFLIVVVGIYYIFLYPQSLRYEKFEQFQNNNEKPTIYEIALKKQFGENTRLMCNMNPTTSDEVCLIDGVKVPRLNFPVQMIKMQTGSILAVFNDGRIYSKDSLEGTIWKGPLDNSFPLSTVPLRMITLTPDLSYLLGVGYDNKLYSRQLDAKTGSLDTSALWKPVTNNEGIIYVMYDRDSQKLVSINTEGKLMIKTTADITSDNTEVTNNALDRPLLRIYYDNFGYMLGLDTSFNLYQFQEKDWKNAGLNLKRGANTAQVNDVIYANDGKMVALVFEKDKSTLTVMKQGQTYYLSPFLSLDMFNSNGETNNYVLSDGDVIMAKIGYIAPELKQIDNDILDQDKVYAFNQQTLKDQQKLRQFCKEKYNITSDLAISDNYDLLTQVEENQERIKLLKDVLDNLIKYEPDKKSIQENYPLLYNA